jgi:hypothetical protein
MKDAEDEAFDELAKRQGHWGGGYQAKRAMAADKLWDRPSVAFDEWWNGDNDESTNPFRLESGAYWAWAGWKAALAQPAQERPWVGLTNYEVNNFAAGCHLGKSVQGAIYEAEAKLKDKNT